MHLYESLPRGGIRGRGLLLKSQLWGYSVECWMFERFTVWCSVLGFDVESFSVMLYSSFSVMLNSSFSVMLYSILID